MRIALVTDTFTPQVNGVTTVLVRMVEALADAGHEATVVAPSYPGWTGRLAGSKAGVTELRIPSLPFPIYPDIRLSAPLFRRVSQHLDTFRPDLVHVVTEGPLGLVGRAYAIRKSIPLVTSFHTNFPRYSRDYGAGWLEPVVWRWLEWFHGPAAITQTPGEAVRDELVDRGIGHAVLWGRGVDVGRFNPGHRDSAWREKHDIPPDAPLIIHVGRLAKEKNLEVLARAWRIVRTNLREKAVFMLVGEGPVAQELEAAMPWAGRIGFIPRDQLVHVYANADMCVLPSDTETLGLVALEGMASGLAVVAADAGGFRETIDSGRDGVLVPARDPLAFAEAILRLSSRPEELRELRQAARRKAESRAIERENVELLEDYKRLIENRKLIAC